MYVMQEVNFLFKLIRSDTHGLNEKLGIYIGIEGGNRRQGIYNYNYIECSLCGTKASFMKKLHEDFESLENVEKSSYVYTRQ